MKYDVDSIVSINYSSILILIENGDDFGQSSMMMESKRISMCSVFFRRVVSLFVFVVFFSLTSFSRSSDDMMMMMALILTLLLPNCFELN